MKIGAWLLCSTLSCVAAGAMPCQFKSSQTIPVTASALGWQPGLGLCRGHFTSAPLNSKGLHSGYRMQAKDIKIQDHQVSATGDIQVRWPLRFLKAEKICVWTPSGQARQLYVEGPVQFDWPEGRVVADRAQVNATGTQGVWHDAWYRLSQKGEAPKLWGHADQITINHRRLHVKGATYSRCAPTHNHWHVETKDLWIDQAKGRAAFKFGILKVGDVPVFAWPYLSFPIDHRRVTGWLIPHFANNTHEGMHIGWPWYWNIAPNQDLTITPEWTSQSGVGLGFKWRHLSRHSSTQLSGLGFFNDVAFRSFRKKTLIDFEGQPLTAAGLSRLEHQDDQRWAVSLKHHVNLGQHRLNVDWSEVSDDDMLRDFHKAIETQDQQYLLHELRWHWQSQQVESQLLWQDWQVLHSLLLPSIPNAYGVQPQWQGRGATELSSHWQAALFWDLGRFTLTPLKGINTIDSGNRMVLDPVLTFNHTVGLGDLSGQFGLHYVSYDLHQSTASHLHYTVPTVAISWQTGAWLPSTTSLLHHLGLKSFYGWVPFHDQSRVPHFDSVWMADFYPQLFELNRFAGSDLQGDTHHLALGLEWQTLEPRTGRMRWEGSIGQGWAFRRQKICIDTTCRGNVWAHQHLSPLQVLGNFRPTAGLQLTSELAWDWAGDRSVNAVISGAWAPGDGFSAALQYTSMRWPKDDWFSTAMEVQDSRQHALGGQVTAKIYSNWTGYVDGRWDMHQKHLLSADAGLQWQDCCISLKFGVTKRYNGLQVSGQRQFFNGVYFRLGLEGLGSEG